ncbi:DEAD/DEAH box helicase family protein [Roseateles sp. DC23W]|uniref:DEAD/DEAH box helicase family protein n=1 Tax=Pelomonas dachongensis TaxID=3299029 RepID=A0ABW7EPP0_9BURK
MACQRPAAALPVRSSTGQLEATGQLTRFTDGRDPAPRSREVFSFFRPDTLAAWAAQPATLRGLLEAAMPPLPDENLRDCQTAAVTGLEQLLAANRPRALVHLATGAGKTFTAITAVYRLLKFAGAKRILFLVDTCHLGKQAHQEFMAYTPPDDGRTFTELYNVQRVGSTAGVASVVDLGHSGRPDRRGATEWPSFAQGTLRRGCAHRAHRRLSDRLVPAARRATTSDRKWR